MIAKISGGFQKMFEALAKLPIGARAFVSPASRVVLRKKLRKFLPSTV
jgi:hypothetical protein